jgi:hypothetical protein
MGAGHTNCSSSLTGSRRRRCRAALAVHCRLGSRKEEKRHEEQRRNSKSRFLIDLLLSNVLVVCGGLVQWVSPVILRFWVADGKTQELWHARDWQEASHCVRRIDQIRSAGSPLPVIRSMVAVRKDRRARDCPSYRVDVI